MNTSIYLLEPDAFKREELLKVLSPLKSKLCIGDSLADAVPALSVNPTRLVIAALELETEESGLDLFLWLRQCSPSTTVILLTHEKNESLNYLVQWNGGYILNYADIKQIYGLIVRIFSYQNELRFSLNGIGLFELVQVICLSQVRKDIYLNEISSGEEGMICFEQGRIKHAVLGNSNGENALFQIMQMQRGVFGEAQNVPEACYTIESETSSLLARSALLQDHAQFSPFSVLIIDQQLDLEALLHRNYANRLEILTIDANKALACLAFQSYDLTVIHLDVFTGKPDLFTAIAHHPQLNKCLWIGSEAVLHEFSHALKEKKDSFFLFPLQTQEMLAWIQSSLFEPSFEGELLNLQLFDCLQILGLSNRPRQLECYDAFLGQGGEMWLANGMVLHATFGDVQGLEALAYWIRLKVGHVFISDAKVPEQISIQQPVTRLLMNMAVTLDQAALLPEKLSLNNGRVLFPSAQKMLDTYLSERE